MMPFLSSLVLYRFPFYAPAFPCVFVFGAEKIPGKYNTACPQKGPRAKNELQRGGNRAATMHGTPAGRQALPSVGTLG